MKNLNQLLFLGFLLLLTTKIVSAQMSTGYKPVFVTHYDKVRNYIPHDTVRYVVDATSHLNVEDENEADLVVDTVDYNKLRKTNVTISLQNAMLKRDILFAYRDYSLTDASKDLLNKASIVMLQNPNATFEIGGHADARGIYKDNLKLTEQRVEAAIEYLVSKGVNRKQLVPMAYGETVLKNVCDSDSHCTEEVHSTNRRVEIRVISVGN